jgi:transposase InsO family protein
VALNLCLRRVTLATSAVLDATSIRVAQDRVGAVRQRCPGLLYYSDRGRPYVSGGFRARLPDHGIVCNMSRRGNCWDDTVAESALAGLTRECVRKLRWPKRASLLRGLARCLDGQFKRARSHPSIDCVNPLVYEQHLVRPA